MVYNRSAAKIKLYLIYTASARKRVREQTGFLVLHMRKLLRCASLATLSAHRRRFLARPVFFPPQGCRRLYKPVFLRRFARRREIRNTVFHFGCQEE